ncbi:hypothetical protein BJ138DRAFT_1140595 [Hygrophoropsis aurantiaca]|uniref:Uncharacterized protein n=1 Tax=Hygrophoropsis aurantiaca TaxID=72124 RepID=A0ACB8ASY6_9AGAM|nr:hypothetical protein BJ138DRAFT_1140595 [Hygrophoropsis aurantiaca]
MRATDVASVNTGDYFHRLASLSSQLIQNSCACTKEEDKLKAFTDLSSQLSQTAPAAAKAMAPTLLAVVVSHSQHKERVERVIQEIDSLWGELFSVFANGIATALDVKLQNSLEALRQEKDLVRSGVHAQSISLKRKAKDTETDPSLNEGLKQSAIEDSAHKETDNMSVHTEQRYPDSSENKRRRLVMGSNRTVEQPPLVPDAGIQEILASLMSQMAKQTQALEMLAQENHQLQYEQADSADNRPSSRRSESFDDFAGSYSSNPVNP